jgi:nitrate reductase gamma subunit
MTILIAVAVIAVLIAFYVVWLRPRMKATAWGQAFLSKIEPMERILYWKSETMLWSRFKVFFGTVMTTLVAVDWNSVAPLIPEKYRSLVLVLPTIFVALDGLMGEKMRRETTQPLEVVAMRTDAPVELKLEAAEAKLKTAQTVEAIKASEAV